MAGRQRWVGGVLVVDGVAASVVGIVGLVSGSSGGSTRSSAAATTTTEAPETAAQFLDQLGRALRGGTAADTAFLFARLHPAVTARYGDAACRTAVAGYHDPTANFVVVSVGPPGDYSWTTDGQTTVVPATVTVTATVTQQGRSATGSVHLTPVDGKMRWFTDCTP